MGKDINSFKAPLNVQWELTSDCNNKCVHCYNYWRQSDESDKYRLTQSDADYIVDNLGKGEVFNIVLTGGEPLIRKDLFYNIIDRAKEYNMTISVNTNATLITPEEAQKLKDHGVRGVLTSLLTADKEKHNYLVQNPKSFNQTLEGIENLLDAGVPVGVNMVVMQENKDDVYTTGKFLSEKGVKNFYATRISPSFAEKNHLSKELDRDQVITFLDELVRVKEDFGINVDTLEPIPHCLVSNPDKYGKLLARRCSAAVSWCAIGSDGTVRPCTHIDEKYGSLLEEDIQDIWKKMNKWRDGSLTPEYCKPCDGVDICGSGCRTSALAHGELNDPDPWCTSPDNFVKRNTKIEPIDEFKRYKLPKDIRFRTEEFGAIAYISQLAFMAIDNDGFELMRRLSKFGDFSVKDLEKINTNISLTRRFLAKLKYNSLLIESV